MNLQCVPVLKYNRLPLSWSWRDSLEYFEISVPRYIRFAELRKTINRTTSFNKWICNLTPEVKRYIENIVEKRSNFSSYIYIFWYMLLDFDVRTGVRFSLRDKRLFEISEVKIMRVDCMLTKDYIILIIENSSELVSTDTQK